MPTSESTPLLPAGGALSQATVKKFEPIGSTKHLLLGSWINLLLVAVPLSFIGMYKVSETLLIVAEHLEWTASARFATSFLAIIPLAKVSEILQGCAEISSWGIVPSSYR